MKNILSVVAFTLCLAGCTKVVVQNPNASPKPVATPVPSPVPTSTPSPTPSPTPVPTASPTPTPTSSPTPKPTPLPTATPQASPTPTLAPSPTPIASVSPYTVLKASADSKMIYVAANGIDTNPGTIDKPVKTIFKAQSLMRNGFPDWMLLRRGDKWAETFITDLVGLSWHWSGRSTTERMVITSYSDPKSPSSVRPEINTGANSGFITWGSSNFALVGINFHDSMRDPNSPDFVTPVVKEPTGLRFGGNTTNWLIEDCIFDSYAQNLTIDAQGAVLFNFSNIAVRYNVIKNAYGNNRSQGLYAGNVNGLLIEGNVFNHNGWTEQTAKTKTWNFMAQNHNVYLRHDNTGVVVRNNIIASGADCGLELRPGGTVDNNLFVQNHCNMTIGLVNGAAILKGGVTAEVMNNVFLDGRADATGATCMEIGNTKQVSVHDNICAREVNDPSNWGYGIMFEIGNGVSNPADGLGIQNTTVQKNVVYAWGNGWTMQNGLQGGKVAYDGFHNLVFQNNEVQGILRKASQHEAMFYPNDETLSKNIYSAAAGQKAGVFQYGVTNLKTTTYDWANYVKSLEPNATYQEIKYPDPANGSVEAYNKSTGGSGTLLAFLADMELQSSLNYKPSRTAVQVNTFVRSKFGK